MRRYASVVTAALFIVGCAQGPLDDGTNRRPRGKADGHELLEGGVYAYVLGHAPGVGQILGGRHQVIVPSLDGREPIDSANRPSRLHPDLRGDDYMIYDPNNTSGESERYVFASQWWPQSKNGLGWRWVPGAKQGYEDLSDKDTLSPVEKYDTFFSTGSPQKVKCGGKLVTNDDGKQVCQNWSWKDMQKPEDERGTPYEQPIVTVAGPATKWELENHGIYQRTHPDSWWGHCNGWASYATAEAGSYPKRDVRVKLVEGKITECTGESTEGCMLFRMGDIEALMSELYFSDSATFAGRRCNTEPDEIERDEFGRPKDVSCRDINAGTFHVSVTGLLGKGAKSMAPGAGAEKIKQAFIIDHNYDYQVWNFPLTRFQVDSAATKEITKEQAATLVGVDNGEYSFNANATRFVQVKATYWMVSDGVPASTMLKRADQRGVAEDDTVLNYVLELDNKGTILGGEWIKDPTYSWGSDSKELHPDFLWAAVKVQGSYEDGDDLGGSGDNPYIAYSKVKALLECANDAKTCAPADSGGGEGGDQVLLPETQDQIMGGRDTTKEYTVQVPQGARRVVALLTPTSGDPDIKSVGSKGCGYKDGLEAEKCVLDAPAQGPLTVTIVNWKPDSAYKVQVVAEMGDNGGGGGPANICASSCGKQADGYSCYCDASCKQYGDCCQDASGTKGSGQEYLLQVCTL